ncbi:hypothetical protein NPIL_268841, partial [Nephila pilipes]
EVEDSIETVEVEDSIETVEVEDSKEVLMVATIVTRDKNFNSYMYIT